VHKSSEVNEYLVNANVCMLVCLAHAGLGLVRGESLYEQILALTLLHIHTLPGGTPLLCCSPLMFAGGEKLPPRTLPHAYSFSYD